VRLNRPRRVENGYQKARVRGKTMQVDLLMTAIILIIITRRSQKSKRKKHALISFARVFCYTLNSEVLEGLGPPLIPKKNTM